jgi:molecular chaperone GrpE
MTKKKKEVIKEVENTEGNTNLQEEEVKTSPTTEELLDIEKDKNIRLIAEFENFRKRNAKERIEFFSTANKDIMTSLLPILDNFERSIESNNYTDEDGTMIIYKQLKSELEKKGLNEIENPIGKELDTNFHEAITNIPAPTKKEIGKIIDSVEKGYMLGEKVIRYTKVILGK